MKQREFAHVQGLGILGLGASGWQSGSTTQQILTCYMTPHWDFFAMRGVCFTSH